MSKLSLSTAATAAAAAALMVAAMPAAFAQAPNASAPPSAANPPAMAQANHILPGQLRFSDMNGATVYDPQNNQVGDINNVVVDPNGRVVAVAVKTGAFLGIGGKIVAIGMNDLNVTTDSSGKPRFSVNLTKDQLKSAQTFDLTPPSTTETGSSTPPARQ